MPLSKGTYRAYLPQAIAAKDAQAIGIPGEVIGLQWDFRVNGFSLIVECLSAVAHLKDGGEFDYTNTMTREDKISFRRDMSSMLSIPVLTLKQL